MAFVVNPQRKKTFHAKHDDGLGKDDSIIEYSVTFDFVIAEDVDYGELRDLLADKSEIEILDDSGKPMKDPKTGEPIATAGMMNAYFYTLRTSLVDCDGIVDPEGKPIVITDTVTKKVNEINQKAIFEAIRLDADLMEKIQIAYMGIKSKN